MSPSGRHLGVVVCGAGPATGASQLIDAAQRRGWSVSVIATPTGVGFLDTAAVETATGTPIRTQYRPPGTPRRLDRPAIQAFIVAPATYNTINKLAAGISDTYALGALAEAIGRVPVIVVPFINTALATRAPLRRSIHRLRAEGVHVLLGDDSGWTPHPPGTGDEHATRFPWLSALDLADASLPGGPGT